MHSGQTWAFVLLQVAPGLVFVGSSGSCFVEQLSIVSPSL
jgi:hypothetical protein